MAKTFIALGAALMIVAVAAGAFGAHGLRSYFDAHPDLKLESWWETAVQYHVMHALGLFVIAWATTQFDGVSLVNWAGWLLLVGILIFSGSLYLMTFTRQTWLGAITPIGGVAFIAGWTCLLWAAVSS